MIIEIWDSDVICKNIYAQLDSVWEQGEHRLLSHWWNIIQTHKHDASRAHQQRLIQYVLHLYFSPTGRTQTELCKSSAIVMVSLLNIGIWYINIVQTTHWEMCFSLRYPLFEARANLWWAHRKCPELHCLVRLMTAPWIGPWPFWAHTNRLSLQRNSGDTALTLTVFHVTPYEIIQGFSFSVSLIYSFHIFGI